MSDHVWVVSQWIWGGGGDDERRVIAVCRTAQRAYEIASAAPSDQHHHEAEVMAFPLDEVVPDAWDDDPAGGGAR